MSSVLILKVDDTDINEQEALAVIENIAQKFQLRITIHGHTDDDSRFWDMRGHVTQQHLDDLDTSRAKNELIPLVDDEEGIIGYVLDGSMDNLLEVLNGVGEDE